MNLEALFSLKPSFRQGTLFSFGHSLRGWVSSRQVKLGWQLKRRQLWSPSSPRCRTEMTGKGVLGALYSTKGAGEKTLRLVKLPANPGSHIHWSPNNTKAGPSLVPYSVFQRIREPHCSPVMCPVLQAPYGGGVLSYSCLPPLNIYFYNCSPLWPPTLWHTKNLRRSTTYKK